MADCNMRSTIARLKREARQFEAKEREDKLLKIDADFPELVQLRMDTMLGELNKEMILLQVEVKDFCNLRDSISQEDLKRLSIVTHGTTNKISELSLLFRHIRKMVIEDLTTLLNKAVQVEMRERAHKNS